MRGYYGLVLRWPGRERFLLIRIHDGKRRLAVLSLLKRRSAELLAVIYIIKRRIPPPNQSPPPVVFL
jgi:hypothetical protein